VHDEIRVVQLDLSEWPDMRLTSSHLFIFCCLLLGFSVGPVARAGVLLKAESVGLPGATLSKVSATFGDDPAGGVSVSLSAAKVDVPAMGWRHLGLTLVGKMQRDDRLRWILDGKIQLVGAPGKALADANVKVVLSESANSLLIDIDQGKAHVNTALPLDQPTHAQIRLDHLPTAWLSGLLGTVWSGRPTGGRIDAKLGLDLHDTGLQSSGQFTLSDTGFDTPSGTLAGQAVNASGRFNLDTTGGPAQMDLDATFRGGELLLGTIYAKLPARPVQLGLHATAHDGSFALTKLRINDPEAPQLNGALAFNAKGDLSSLRLDSFHASFPAAYNRYGQAWLATMGMRNMTIAGQLDGSVDMRADGLHAFSFNTDQLDLADGEGRLAAEHLRGGLDWSIRGDPPATTLGWQRLQFYRLSNGAAQSSWRSHGGTLSLQQPLEVPLLKGQLRVSELIWRPAALKGERLATSLALTGLDMSAFSRAMGWPAFPGTLGGAVPSLRWIDDRIELDGGLSASVFGGFMNITQLSLEHPLGNSPALSGDIAFSQLDLAAVTSVFDFGSITGRLNASINNFRLVNWSPVAFDAQLLAGSGGRISQRAVNNLTSVGGGGIAAGLQGAVLKLFKTFGYRQIGLDCSLRGIVCTMSGLEPTDDGYTIVQGSGLPRLHVIGHQRQVDWPTLVKRLQDAINGSGPVIH
jgi:hypothetical protein